MSSIVPVEKSAGASDALDFYHQATKLGAGREALLGLVQAALKEGTGRSASTLAAASRCVLCSIQRPLMITAISIALAYLMSMF